MKSRVYSCRPPYLIIHKILCKLPSPCVILPLFISVLTGASKQPPNCSPSCQSPPYPSPQYLLHLFWVIFPQITNKLAITLLPATLERLVLVKSNLLGEPQAPAGGPCYLSNPISSLPPPHQALFTGPSPCYLELRKEHVISDTLVVHFHMLFLG